MHYTLPKYLISLDRNILEGILCQLFDVLPLATRLTATMINFAAYIGKRLDPGPGAWGVLLPLYVRYENFFFKGLTNILYYVIVYYIIAWEVYCGECEYLFA